MKKIFMAVLLSVVSWAGAAVAAEATASRQSGVSVAQQETIAADTLGGMTPSEAFQVRMKELDLKMVRERALFQSSPDAEDIIDSLVPILGVSFPFLVAFFIVFFYIYYRNKKVQSRYRVMEKAIESGRELPEGFFDESKPKRSDKFTTLNQGLVCMAVGIGSFIWYISGVNNPGATFLLGFAAIFTLIGVGKLILYRVESRKETPSDKERTVEQSDAEQ